MPSLVLKNGVVFAYTDSGAVAGGSSYTTLVIIHGHTFHSGTFQRLNPLAQPNSLRIISVNRREYPGSSPYSAEELSVFVDGNDAERASLLEQQGRDLAMFIDGIAQIVDPTGGIALIGWSLGAIFVLALIGCIATLPPATQERLSTRVHSVIMLQTPSLALGLPTPSGWLIPHTDPDIPAEARGPAFAKWVSSYFLHGDLSTRSMDQLTYNNFDPDRPATIEILKPEELFDMTDFSPAEKYDNIVGLPPFESAVFNQTNKALFDSSVREAWSAARFWSVYGSAEPWNIIYGAWFLEDKLRTINDPNFAINFKVLEGCNHFLVWEDPEKAIDELKECFST
ncbi:AB hydrolase-1 domain-containing protein [Mycena sanguinolenta]|uniref:AB hydrolase-1 domain-containing protein n=1 Tax=Mycena sanguinolenta TaxID=230812 RepID=A0A8H6Y5K1_9AGAR|nr:AB hydrolase-1 domain-containing protein [Mycena sanguinolenta]